MRLRKVGRTASRRGIPCVGSMTSKSLPQLKDRSNCGRKAGKIAASTRGTPIYGPRNLGQSLGPASLRRATARANGHEGRGTAHNDREYDRQRGCVTEHGRPKLAAIVAHALRDGVTNLSENDGCKHRHRMHHGEECRGKPVLTYGRAGKVIMHTLAIGVAGVVKDQSDKKLHRQRAGEHQPGNPLALRPRRIDNWP